MTNQYILEWAEDATRHNGSCPRKTRPNLSKGLQSNPEPLPLC